MRETIDGQRITHTFDSLAEYAEHAGKYIDNVCGHAGKQESWRGGSPEEIMHAARYGWEKHLGDTLNLVESAVTHVERTTDVTDWSPVWDVTGGQVDIGQYLAGEPECMVDYPPSKTSKAGRVITLCASTCYSASVSAEQLQARGTLVTAFALELARLGLSIELWADLTTFPGMSGSTTPLPDSKVLSHRVLVKAANDELDPARVLFAYAHPGMLRLLAFANWHDAPKGHKDSCGIGANYGHVCDVRHDLPEGTIYLPGLRAAYGVTDAAEQLEKMLRELELIA